MIINYISYVSHFNPMEIIDLIAPPPHVTLHVALSLLCLQPYCFHYISQDHPNAHKLTNHILHLSQETGWLLPGSPKKRLCRQCRMVQVLQTGTTSSFPRILSMGMTSGTLHYMISYMISSVLDIIHDIIHDFIVLKSL